MFFMGIDVGSIAAKAVAIDSARKVVASIVMPSGTNHKATASACVSALVAQAGISERDIAYVVSTGYGRNNVVAANKRVTEIACHAKGAHSVMPEVDMVLDIGGQDCKVIKIDGGGRVVDFCMNDRCAAGTGRFLEVMAAALEVDLDEMIRLSEVAQKSAAISNMCTVFAESEVISKIAEGYGRDEIIKGINLAVADRVGGMMRKLGLGRTIVMTGGVAKNTGVVKAIEGKLERTLSLPPNPQIVGALGAAMVALESSSQTACSAI